MGGVPAKCLHCKQDLRYDPISLRYRCPGCEVSETRKESAAGTAGPEGAAGAARAASAVGEAASPPADPWRERGEILGREAARLLRRVQRWLGK